MSINSQSNLSNWPFDLNGSNIFGTQQPSSFSQSGPSTSSDLGGLNTGTQQPTALFNSQSDQSNWSFDLGGSNLFGTQQSTSFGVQSRPLSSLLGGNHHVRHDTPAALMQPPIHHTNSDAGYLLPPANPIHYGLPLVSRSLPDLNNMQPVPPARPIAPEILRRMHSSGMIVSI